MATFKIKPTSPPDAAEITLTADFAQIDTSSGRLNFYTGSGEEATPVGSFVNATFYQVTEPTPPEA